MAHDQLTIGCVGVLSAQPSHHEPAHSTINGPEGIETLLRRHLRDQVSVLERLVRGGVTHEGSIAPARAQPNRRRLSRTLSLSQDILYWTAFALAMELALIASEGGPLPSGTSELKGSVSANVTTMPPLVLWPPPWKRGSVGGDVAAVLYLVAVVFPITLFAGVFILLVVKPYELLFNRQRGPRMTPWQVANVIDRAAAGRVDDDEWDDFTCVPMRDERLTAVVVRAMQIVEKDRPSGRLSADEARELLHALARELRG